MRPACSDLRQSSQSFLRTLGTRLTQFVGSWTALACLCLTLLTPVWLKHQEAEARSRADLRARVLAIAEEEARQQEIELRWDAIEFYATTSFEPGDFPQEGYYSRDGFPWTPERGGECYDRHRRMIVFKREPLELPSEREAAGSNVLIRF